MRSRRLSSTETETESMISLRPIHTSFTTTTRNHDFSIRNRYVQTIIHCCKSKDSPNDPPPASEGDARKQELLARIAMLQTQKVRLTDYLDERSAYLTQFAQEANAEFDQVGENALKELDEASARIMENIESRMQAFEESAESSKLEMEENQKKLNEFEVRFENERNEGLFFKNLGQQSKSDNPIAKEEAQKMEELTKQSAGSETRRNIYLALIGLVTISILDSFVSPSFDWRKSVLLGVILLGLLTQFTFYIKTQDTTKNICLALGLPLSLRCKGPTFHFMFA